jgi:hypothetical protein
MPAASGAAGPESPLRERKNFRSEAQETGPDGAVFTLALLIYL